MLAHGSLYWCIFFLVLQSRIPSSYPVKCSKLLNIFANAVSNYTYCAVSNSRPFRFCCHCKDLYVEALNGHNNIVLDKNCSRELIFAEKHQLVEYAYDFTVDIWKKSNCPDCFNSDKEGRPTAVKSEIKEFFKKLDEVEHCFYNNSQIHVIPVPSNHSGANSSTLHSSLCDKCRGYYNDLEKSYKKIKVSDAQDYKVCGDVSASMNYTRQRWSKNFNCVKIHTDLVSVVALTVFFCFLPVIFYTSVKLQYDYSHERKPELLRSIVRPVNGQSLSSVEACYPCVAEEVPSDTS
ncbi:unnamed protein product, partial [Porites lobata]